MSNLVFCLNATMPVFSAMVLGYIFRRVGLVDKEFAIKLNRFVFLVGFPALLFRDLSESNFLQVWDGKFIGFCVVTTLLSIGISYVISMFLKNKKIRGEFIQASFRSSQALIGISFILNIYGKATAAAMMIVAAVPLYNTLGIFILEGTREGRVKSSAAIWKRSLINIAKNPIISGIIIGLVWSIFDLPVPEIPRKVIGSLAQFATPMGLLAMGMSFETEKVGENLKYALLASFLKLIFFVAIFLPFAVYLGFTHDKLVSILVMLGAASTVTCFVMSKAMGHDGNLSSITIMITTIASAFTLTGWLYILRSLGLV